MTLLAIGVLLWAGVHLFPSLMPGARSSLMGRLGEGPYKGLFALDLVIAILLMVFGWRSATAEFWYAPPLAGTPYLTTALVLIAFVLMGAANAPTNIKRLLRHPMLTGIVVWGAAHLLANGDNRSVVLFGGLSIWAVVAIVTISRRDGEWTKPDPVPVQKDIVLIIIGALLTAVVAYFHEYLSGVPIIGL
ncbi:MAG: NnrU family protein [Gammaproteobacteria bacterium]|nr:NnrU family protein [Gammaproteobacteria bacterium]